MAVKATVTKDGLLIPREVAERALGGSFEDVEILEEPGRLVIAAAGKADDRAVPGIPRTDDPILGLGKHPVRTGARDGSTDHDRHLYAGE